MKFLADFIPSEKHDGDKRGFEEKSHDTFDGKRGAENIAHEPGVVRPVGAEFKFEDDAGGNADNEIDSKQGHPEFGDVLPLLFACSHILGFHDGDNEGEPEGERHKQPVVIA